MKIGFIGTSEKLEALYSSAAKEKHDGHCLSGEPIMFFLWRYNLTLASNLVK